MSRACKIEWCEKKHFGLGYCQEHYKRLKRHGDPLYVPTAEEISKKISKKNKGKIPHNKGKKGVSKETSKKLSKALTGMKRTKETRDNISKGKTKDKKQCKHCGKKFADLKKHYGFCRKNPELKEGYRIKRNEYREANKDKINPQQNAATAIRMKIPEKKEHRQKKQYENRQKPEVKKQNNLKRNISRPKRDKKTREELKKIIGGEDWSKCIQCGFKDHRALPNEHIDDDGYLDNRKFPDKRSRDNYYVAHPEEAKKKLQIFCSNCNEIKKYDLQQEKWNLKHHSKSAERDRKKNSTRKQEVHQVLGGDICNECGFNDPRAMQIDHINGGGRADRAQFSSYYRWLDDIIDNPEKARKKLQILCVNCNIIKQHISDYGHCNCKKFHVDYFKNA